MTTPAPTDVLARLDRRVADAAEAWLADPRDTGIYARLVAAVTERRHVLDALARTPLQPAPDGEAAAAPDASSAAPDEVPPGDEGTGEKTGGETGGETGEGSAEGSGDDEEQAVPLRPVGADLVGDPRAVLDRLRRG